MTSNGAGGYPPSTVAQAQGVVSVPADCSLDHALLLMQACASASRVPVEAAARAVIDGGIRFGVDG